MAGVDLKDLDKRIAERMIRNGELDEEAWDKHLASLPDVGENAEPITSELETGVLEDR